MVCHTPPLNKKLKKTRGIAITNPQSHPISYEWDETRDCNW